MTAPPDVATQVEETEASREQPGRAGPSGANTGAGPDLAVRARAAVASIWAMVRAAGRTLVRRLLPIVRPVTVLGWVAIASAIVMYLLSQWGGWQEFAVGAVALAAAFLVAVLFTIGRSHYEVGIDLRTHRVVVGEPATGRLEVTNASSRRMLPSRMELPVGRGVGRLSIPGLKPAETHEELFVVPTERRAVIEVGPARSVRGDAFGLVRRVVRWTEPEMLYVHPRTISLSGAVAGFFKDLEGEATKELSNDDVSFHALRGYVPGDDRRYIHWRTTARTGQIMVRQFEETRRSHVAVGLSTSDAEYAEDAEFELAVEVCASLTLQSFRDERRLTVISGGAPISAPTPRRTLDRLSGVDRGPTADGIVAAARTIAVAVPDVSVALLLCGPLPTPAEIREAGACLPLGVRVIVVRAVAGAATSMRRISDVTVVTIGSLDVLPRALRAARA